MKKLGLIISALALVLGMSQCKKPNAPTIDTSFETEEHSITFSTSKDDGSKGHFNDLKTLLNYIWSETDKIYVYETNTAGDYGEGHGHYCGVLYYVSGANTTSAVFKNSSLPVRSNSVELRFVHYGSSVNINAETGVASIAVTELDGALETVSGKVVALCDKAIEPLGIYDDSELEVQFSVAKFDLSAFAIAGGDDTDGKYICSDANTVNVNAYGNVTYTQTGSDASTAIADVKSSSTSYFVAVIPNDANQNKVTVDFTMNNGYNGYRIIPSYQNNKYYYSSINNEIGIPVTPINDDGSLPGTFTVGASNDHPKTVKFSRGNVQFYNVNTSSVTSANWRFAKYQWEVIGADNVVNYQLPSGWIDLFGWGCASAQNLDSRVMIPWEWRAYPSESDYGGANPNRWKRYGPPSGGHLNNWKPDNITNYNRYDWGHNFGSYTWFTMLPDQWSYLLGVKLNGTATATCRAESCRFAKGEVCGVPGLIIFPDGWSSITLPTGIAVTNFNVTNVGFSVNQYDENKWAVLENYGAVFLPVAATREVDQSSPFEYNKQKARWSGGGKLEVYYWTGRSSGDGTTGGMWGDPDKEVQLLRAIRLTVEDGFVGFDHANRFRGFAVRLAKVAE